MHTSSRIKRLIENRKHMPKASEIPVRDACYLHMFQEHKMESIEKQFAYGFSEFLKNKAISIQPDDLLAGYSYHYTYNTTFPAKSLPHFEPSKRGAFIFDVAREVQDCIDIFQIGPDSDTAKDLHNFQNSVSSWLFKHWHSGHFLAGYDYLLENGFGKILEKEQEALSLEKDPKKRDSIESFIIVTKACISYIERYEQFAREKSKSAICASEKTQMIRIMESCKRIALGKPQNFFDAIQLYWFAHELILAESYPSSISLGRFDYYLYPFYEKDLQNGSITPEEASELIDAFWIKVSANVKAFQNLTLGGTDANGKCSVNALTYLCLDTTARMRFDQPSVTFRWTDNMPEDVWHAILELIKTGMGFPAIFNEDCCLKTRKHSGIEDKDLYRYSFVGCVEFAIPGKEYTLTEIARLNLPKVLEIMLHGGTDPVSGFSYKLTCVKNPEEILTFEELFEWYLNEMTQFIDFGLRNIYLIDKMYGIKYPLPLLSTFTENCIEQGMDISSGGAKYNNSSLNIGGLATIVDSLASIRELVFRQKKITLTDYIHAMDQNFEGYEDLRLFASNKCPKFGNDLDEVDQIGLKIIDKFTRTAETYETPRGGKYRVGLYTVEDHVRMGCATGATADGRLAKTAFSNSMGPSQGKDTNGPTALLNTINKFDFTKATNGMVLDIKFTPTFLEAEEHSLALKSLIETYFRRGGMEIQVSVVSRDLLIDAQKHPENYQDLIVRVSGFSAYFHSLQKETQDEIIQRTEVS